MNTLLDMAQPFSLFLLDAALKSSLLLALLFLADRGLPSAQAAWRNLLWRMGMIGLLLIPAAAAVLPVLYVPVSAQWTQTPVVQLAVQSAPMPASETSAHLLAPVIVSPAPRLGTDNRDAPLAPSPPLDLKQVGMALAAALYLAGLLFFLARLGAGMISVSRLRRRSVEITDEHCLHHLRSLKAHLGMRFPVLLSTGEPLSGPTQIGCVHPLIVLPAQTLPSTAGDTLRSILAHELAHIRRGDYLFNLVAGLALALHWFNPLAWLGVRRLRQTSEQACDDWTVEMVGDHDHYARTLVEVAAGVQPAKALALGANMATASRVGQRIERIITLGGSVSPQINKGAGAAFITLLTVSAIFIGISDLYAAPPALLARLLYIAQTNPASGYNITGYSGCVPPKSRIRCYYSDGSKEEVAAADTDGAFVFQVPYERGKTGFSIKAVDQKGHLSAAMYPRLDNPVLGGCFIEPTELGWANIATVSADEEENAKVWEASRESSHYYRIDEERWLHSIGKTQQQAWDEGIFTPDSIFTHKVIMPPVTFDQLENLKIYGYTPVGEWVTCIICANGRSFTTQIQKDGRFSVVIPQEAIELNRRGPSWLINVTDAENRLLSSYNTQGAIPKWAVDRQAIKDKESLLGQPAPDFTLPSADGKETIRFRSLKALPTLIYFWGLWDLADLPAIQNLYSSLPKEEVRVLTVQRIYVQKRQRLQNLENFMREKGYTFPVLVDTTFTMRDIYKLWLAPRTIIIDPTGTIRFSEEGPISEEKLRTALAEYTD